MGFRGRREIKVNRDRSEKFCYNEHENRWELERDVGLSFCLGGVGTNYSMFVIHWE